MEEQLNQLRLMAYQVKEKYGPEAAAQFYLEYVHPIRIYLNDKEQVNMNFKPNFRHE